MPPATTTIGRLEYSCASVPGADPTLKIFQQGKKDSVDYEGPREVDDIVKYLERVVTSQTMPMIAKPEDLTALAAKSNQGLLLGLFRQPVLASAAYKTFKQAAFDFHGQGVTFVYSAGATAPPVAPLNAAGKKPTVPGLVTTTVRDGDL